MKDTIFYKQANLVLDILPLLEKIKSFALKGGTAINYFIRDMPRLSVDIDLTYLPIKDWEETVKSIHNDLNALAEDIMKSFQSVRIAPFILKGYQKWRGLQLSREEATIKVEHNFVIRGCVYQTSTMRLRKRAQDFFEKSVKVNTLSFADLYGSKICAALDRQHPRDLFDIKLLLEGEGITDEVRIAFIVYLISHNRPMHELLKPNFQDLTEPFDKEFNGLTFQPITIEELVDARERLLIQLLGNLTEKEREFIISVKSKDPKWGLIEINHIKELPSVQWKLANLYKMDTNKHKLALKKLERIFSQ